MKAIKKHLLSVLIFGFFIFIAFGSEDDTNQNSDETTETYTSNEEKNQALIESCKSIDGIVDDTVVDNVLTIRAFITKKEGQKLSIQMLNEINKYELNINSVIVLDLDYNMVGRSER